MPTESVEDVQQIASSLQTNVDYVNEKIGIGTSWDIIAKPFEFGGFRMMAYVTNGYFTTVALVKVLDDIHKCVETFITQHQSQPFTANDLVAYLEGNIPFVQVQPVDKMKDAIHFILSGPMVFFIEGYAQAFMVDTRIYPMRSISTPNIERAVRGASDGFTETMLMNCALIRRRIRDARLRNELFQVGSVSETDVSLMYLNGLAPDSVVNSVRHKLKTLETDDLFMGEQSLVEHIADVKWNPYPVVRYTERPDVAATAISEGHVVIIVDTSPEAVIAPTTLFNHMQNPGEYHSYPLLGTYMRWVILGAVLISVLLPGVFLMMNFHPEMMPAWLTFFKAKKNDPLPLWAELIIAEIGLDLLRLAVLNTPSTLASSVGIVAALLFGQFAAKIQLLQPEVLVYMGLVMIAQFATSSFELGSANQMARYWVIAWTALLKGWGFLIACVGWLLLLGFTKSFGVPYLWPLVPFQWKHGLREVILRYPMKKAVNKAYMPTKQKSK